MNSSSSRTRSPALSTSTLGTSSSSVHSPRWYEASYQRTQRIVRLPLFFAILELDHKLPSQGISVRVGVGIKPVSRPRKSAQSLAPCHCPQPSASRGPAPCFPLPCRMRPDGVLWVHVADDPRRI